MDKTAYCNEYSQVDSLRPLPMGLHKSLIQEQFRSFQDSCVGFFVSSQALRISSNCVLELRLDSAACLLFQHSAGWELGLHSESPPHSLPPKNEGGRRAAVSHTAVWTVCLRDLCPLAYLQRSTVFSYPSNVRPSTQAADFTVYVSELIHNLVYDTAFRESDNYVSCFFVLNGTGAWTQNQC